MCVKILILFKKIQDLRKIRVLRYFVKSTNMLHMKRKQVEKNCMGESEKNVHLFPYISIPGCRDDKPKSQESRPIDYQGSNCFP